MFRILLVFIQIWIIFKFGNGEELTIVADADKTSYIVVENSDRGVYCTANGKPIKLEDSCIPKAENRLNKSVKPNEHAWSLLSIYKSPDEHKVNLENEYIFLSVYSIDTNEIVVKLNEVELKFTKKNQCKGWNDLTIQCINNTLNFHSDCFENKSLNNCSNQYITNITVKSVGQNETIYWKLGLDTLRKLNTTTTKILDIKKGQHKDYVKTYAYNGTVMLKIKNTEMKRINDSNWYYLNLAENNINNSTLDGSSSNGGQIGSVYLCRFMERVYKFYFEREKNYSCGFQNDSQEMINMKKSETYTYKDLNKIANDTRLSGKYVCTKSKCFCKSGSVGDYCDKSLVCSQRWGDNCDQKCGFCRNNQTCHHLTGKCRECIPGFFTDYCTEKFEFNYTVYSKNQTHMWIRWNTNRNNSDVFFKIPGKIFQNSDQCILWTKYSNYRCSILNFHNNTIFEVLSEYGAKNWTVFNLTNIEFDTVKTSEAPLNLSSDSNKIFWSHPDITNGPLTYFLINISSFNISDQCQINKTITKEQNNYEINYKYNTNTTKCYEENNIIYLHPARKYNITVTPFNTIEGNSSKITVSQGTMEEKKIENSTILIISAILVFIIALIIGGLSFIFFRRRFGKKPDIYLLENVNLEKDWEYPLNNLQDHIIKYFGVGNFKLEEIFNVIPKKFGDDLTGSNFPTKNRYKNILPYESNRVILPNDGYINASYIDGYETKKKFIATQGPTKNTLKDFWTMIVCEKVRYIVMLTNLQEYDKVKCEQYWPEEGFTYFDNIQVKIIKEKKNFHYSIREFEVTQGSLKLKVTQFHFTSWYDHNITKHMADIIPFFKIIFSLPSNTPIVVHCSAGIGRTGTVLLTDIAVKIAEQNQLFDFENSLTKLRKQRMNLVDNPQQFFFCYVALYEYLEYQDFTILKDGKLNRLNEMDEYLEKVKWLDDLHCYEGVSDISDDNKLKNRDPTLVPGNSRAYLTYYPPSNPDSNYINAVRADCYNIAERYICTQEPLTSTVGDFWRLVNEYDIENIVSLNNLENVFYDENIVHPCDFLELSTNDKSEDLSLDKIQMTLTDLNENKKLFITIHQLKNWTYPKPISDNPKDIAKILRELTDKKKILVICRDGCLASGVFLAASVAINQINTENKYNIVDAIRRIRKSRVEFIKGKDQIQFIQQIITQYNKNK